MLHKISKGLRFCAFLPVAFVPPQMKENILRILWQVPEMLRQHEKIVCLALILFGTVLLTTLRSAAIYAYDAQEVPVYLGRLPVFWGREKKIYLPAYYLRRAETPRFFLKISPCLVKMYPKLNLQITKGDWKVSLPMEQVIAFSVPLGE
jgi:hypothetical protein